MNSFESYESYRHNTMHQATKKVKKFFPELKKKLFSLDSFKSRHPVLEFSNHHQHNLQSEHTESQFRPAHLLILAETLHLTVCSCHLRVGGLSREPEEGGMEGWSSHEHIGLLHFNSCMLLKKVVFLFYWPPAPPFNLKLNEDLSWATALQA